MEHDIWKKSRFTYPDAVPTMLSRDERYYLYWLGRSVWSGQGAVVEIGPWLGGSTVCLAAGMQASGNDAHKQLKVFDNFLWREFMAVRAPLPIKPGDSFKDFFLKNIKDYQGIVEVHIRALPDEPIEDDHEASNKRFFEVDQIPIFEGANNLVEILFIDGAKSWRGMLHLMKLMSHQLIPGKSLIACQDFKYWGTYWVPALMMKLEHYLEPVHNILEGTTVTFRLTSNIPGELFESLEDNVKALHTEQTIMDLEKAGLLLAEDGDIHGSANVLLAKVSFLSHQGRIDDAVEEFRKVQMSTPVSCQSPQFKRAYEYLRTEKLCEIPGLKNPYSFYFLKEAWKKITMQIVKVIK